MTKFWLLRLWRSIILFITLRWHNYKAEKGPIQWREIVETTSSVSAVVPHCGSQDERGTQQEERQFYVWLFFLFFFFFFIFLFIMNVKRVSRGSNIQTWSKRDSRIFCLVRIKGNVVSRLLSLLKPWISTPQRGLLPSILKILFIFWRI